MKTTFGYNPKDVLKRMSCEQIRALLSGYNSYKTDHTKPDGTQETNWDEIDDVSEDEQLELMKAMGFNIDDATDTKKH